MDMKLKLKLLLAQWIKNLKGIFNNYLVISLNPFIAGTIFTLACYLFYCREYLTGVLALANSVFLIKAFCQNLNILYANFNDLNEYNEKLKTSVDGLMCQLNHNHANEMAGGVKERGN